MQDNTHLNVTHKAVSVVDVCVFRAQFGQSRSFSSLSHKNLIMNMEPLVPALPTTNEYEETATDTGRMLLTLHTNKQTLTMPSCTRPLGSHMTLPWVWRCTYATLRPKALIEQLMLPSHQSCLPGDTNCSTLKIPYPWSSLSLPPCLCVSDFVCSTEEGTRKQSQLMLSWRKTQLEVICLAPKGLSLFQASCCSLCTTQSFSWDQFSLYWYMRMFSSCIIIAKA